MDFRKVSSGPSVIGSVSIPVVIGLMITWITIFLSIRKGPELVSHIVRITVPMPVILLVIMIIRGVTLNGAMDGIMYYITPNFSSLAEPTVWVAAFTQVFFSVGVGMAIVISFSSYKYVHSDITRTSIIITMSNALISIMAGFAVFSVLGHLAFQQGVALPEVATGGTGLAFVAFPTAIELMPFAPLFGVIFFLTLLTFALDSAFSFIEAINTSIADSWNISTERSSAIVCTLLFSISLFFATNGGFYWIEIVDHFINNYGVTLVCLVEALFIGWAYKVSDFRKWITAVSVWRLGRWWDHCIRYITPMVIFIIVIASAWEDFLKQFTTGVAQTYGGFPADINNGVFFVVVLLLPIVSWIVFPKIRKAVSEDERG
jgi:NSS family neurotransmitter:Na+ symporter